MTCTIFHYQKTRVCYRKRSWRLLAMFMWLVSSCAGWQGEIRITASADEGVAVCGFIFFSKRSKRLCSFSWRKKKEPKEHPPNQAFPIWKDVIDFRQRPPYIKVLVSLSSLCPELVDFVYPFRVRDKFFIGLRGEEDGGINSIGSYGNNVYLC